VQHPILYYLSALKHLLNEEGIDISSCAINETRGARPQPASLLWTHSSPPLSELIPPIMKMSLNLGAETLVRSLGLQFRGEGTFVRGKEVVEETLNGMGVGKDSYVYADGSGLSRLNLVSADALIRILTFMHRHRNFAAFMTHLQLQADGIGMDAKDESGKRPRQNRHLCGRIGSVGIRSNCGWRNAAFTIP
jgi:D-alanyl-D-alanine carboxypeptidase/D-alanyl-D-alanine-endopeptidase (penicillin-binding protein 4)